ncbi:MAG: DUF4192 family protein [Amnibacterium sp.]
MTQIVKAAGPADLLRLVPRLVGFKPVESLVLVAFEGRRTGAAMRFDLPGTDDPLVLEGIARHLMGLLCRVEGVDGLVPVVYTAAPLAAAPVTLLDLLAAAADDAGLVVKDALCVAGDGWARMPDGPRHPLAELGPDSPHLLDPAAELRLPEVSDAARARFAEQLAAWRTRPAGPGGAVNTFRPGADLGGRSCSRGEPFLQRAALGLRTGPLLEGMLAAHATADDPCPCLAALAAFAEVPDLAAHLLLHIAWGPRFGERVRRSWLERDEDDAEAEAALNGGEVRRPSVPRIEAGIRAVKAAMAHLEPDSRGPLAACAAWLEWALGRGSLAGAFLDTALAVREPSAFAVVLGLRLQRGVLPEWAFREQPGLSIEEQLRRIA